MKIAIGSDHAGYELKSHLKGILKNKGIEVLDVGCDSIESVDYPLYGKAVANAVVSGECDRGIAICGTGIGISIACNREKKVRATLCMTEEMARMSREHNNSNCLCLGARLIDSALAERILNVWLNTDFAGGKHERRINMLDD